MVEFVLPHRVPRRLAGIVAAHGLTDLRLGCRLWAYLLVCVPLPGSVTTGAFIAASLGHFAQDVGALGSFLLHGALLAVATTRGFQPATEILAVYMLLWHVPMHFVRVLSENSPEATASAVAALLLGSHAHVIVDTHTGKNELLFSHVAQRLVVAHALVSQ